MSGFLRSSDQPYSKWQAIFNLEQIKERNRPKIAKESLPKLPFFLFDLDKATSLEGGSRGARDFLAETFFSSFDQKRKAAQDALKQGGSAMEKHGVERKLKGFLSETTVQADGNDWWRKVLDYMKTLSPSGVELEVMNLVSFDFSPEMQANMNFYVSHLL